MESGACSAKETTRLEKAVVQIEDASRRVEELETRIGKLGHRINGPEPERASTTENKTAEKPVSLTDRLEVAAGRIYDCVSTSEAVINQVL